ncbi:MAG: sigma-54 dependent transcriptional regulator [Motiliproteus sp.]|nr:sigma-54 dependent transcriptional regulator [Motiliproteus sp.]
MFGTSEEMQRAKQRAQRLADMDVPTLLLGESGTGKELFARAIHHAGQRKNGPFIPINCGAIPSELIESKLFGHERGAFTGANKESPGCFRDADGGTLFLDEIGELPLEAQVRLLRVLQEGAFQPVGSNKEIKVDVRIIAATHRNLLEMTAENLFRLDLFYRIAVGILELPPLNSRTGEIGELANHLIGEINKDLADQPGYRSKKISVSAKNFIVQHSWPGNVRELRSTLLRAAIWCNGDNLTAKDLKDATLQPPSISTDLFSRQLDHSFDIQKIIGDIPRHYVPMAMKASGGNKTKAAKLLGIKSQQVLTNWIDKYDIDV